MTFLLTAWRFVVLAALMFWVGGFTFYTSVVVPVGTRVLKSTVRQGFITREVTVALNYTGAIALAVLALEALTTRDTSRVRFWARVALWVLMAACQGLLFWLHGHLDAMLDLENRRVAEAGFYTGHRVYLWAHTVQWGFALVFILLLLSAWRAGDRRQA